MDTKTDDIGQILAGQVAVVTGSTQGIGAGIASKLAAHGVRVVIHGLNDDSKTLNAIRDAGGEGVQLQGNLEEEAACRQLIRGAVQHFGRLGILVNNAGIFDRATIEDCKIELWDKIFAINLRAPFILCQEAVKHMKERRQGCIINIGSVNAYVGELRLLPYSASKGGMMTFTKNLGNYLTQYRIRVNQINPGWVLTEGEDRMQSVVVGKGKKWLDDALKTRPFGRMLQPDDIARAVIFLASTDLITGAVIDFEQTVIGANLNI
jgi:NAD(P)-dependent dehydrogenase (short-subunit alcohol dehydrogenase family)